MQPDLKERQLIHKELFSMKSNIFSSNKANISTPTNNIFQELK